jgi:hypothetical protein
MVFLTYYIHNPYHRLVEELSYSGLTKFFTHNISSPPWDTVTCLPNAYIWPFIGRSQARIIQAKRRTFFSRFEACLAEPVREQGPLVHAELDWESVCCLSIPLFHNQAPFHAQKHTSTGRL